MVTSKGGGLLGDGLPDPNSIASELRRSAAQCLAAAKESHDERTTAKLLALAVLFQEQAVRIEKLTEAAHSRPTFADN